MFKISNTGTSSKVVHLQQEKAKPVQRQQAQPVQKEQDHIRAV
jgi:hypothetical protein